MDLNKEIILGLGFKETKVKSVSMYRYDVDGVEPLYLDKTRIEKEVYMLYKKNEYDELTPCGCCSNLTALVEQMMKANIMNSIKVGRRLSQEEIRRALGL